LILPLSIAAAAAGVFLSPLPWLDHPCEDPRYPQLAGPWAVGCGPGGRVDRAQHIETGERVVLEGAVVSPGVGPGVLHDPGAGTWRPPAHRPTPAPTIPGARIAPPGTDGALVALAGAGAIQWRALGGDRRHRVEAEVMPWYPPAVGEGFIAWVAPDGAGGTRVMALDTATRHVAALPAGAHPRHVAASGAYLGWIEDGAVVVRGPAGDARHPADARSARRLALDGEVACWEQWVGAGVDAVCSDGLVAGGPGDQRNPSRWGPWLLFVQDERPRLATRRGP